MTSHGVKNVKIFEISAFSYNKSVLARKLEGLERRGKKHSTALLILNVPDVIRFEVRSTVWPPEVMQGQNSRFSWKSFFCNNSCSKYDRETVHTPQCLSHQDALNDI